MARVAPAGTILVTCIASIGKNTLLEHKAGFNQQINALIPYEEKYDSYFLLMQSFRWSQIMMNTAASGTMQIVNKNEFSKITSFVTESDEQKLIGKLFFTIDRLITLHQRKLDLLKEMKKTLLSMLFPKNGSSIPEARFTGFTDAWEQRKLGDTFRILQNNTLSRSELVDDKGDAVNIHYGDILTKFGDCLDIRNQQLPYINDYNIVNKLSESLLRNGDIIVADTAEDDSVGKATEIMGVKEKIVISGLHTIPLRPNESFGQGYLGYYFNSESYRAQLRPLMQGVKVMSVSKSGLKETLFSYPRYEEQILIGKVFSSVDNLITLHQ